MIFPHAILLPVRKVFDAVPVVSFSRILVILVASGGLFFCPPATQAADLEPPPYPEQIIPEPLSDEDTGFRAIFDGKTLQDWDGDPTYWRIENGAIVGETTKERAATTFMIWRGGKPADFELKLEYRINPMGNSGVQYRSTELPWERWGLRGYQADASGAEWGKGFFEEYGRAKGWESKHFAHLAGVNYDEWGRAFLAFIGQLSYVGHGERQRVLASLGDPETLARIPGEDWNRLHLIVRGNVMIHIVNDRVMSIVIDDDTANRRMEGLLGLQVHGGDPMKVAFRHIRLKTYDLIKGDR